MTGCEDLLVYHLHSPTDGVPAWWERREIFVAPSRVQDSYQYYSNQDMIDCDAMWSTLVDYDNANYIMGCSIGGDVVEKNRNDGLVERHAYTLLGATFAKEWGVRLVKIRNPWGNAKEWNGDWSDSSAKWEEYPGIAEAVGFSSKPDGLFWMSWEDFLKTFTSIDVCAQTMPTQRASRMKSSAS